MSTENEFTLGHWFVEGLSRNPVVISQHNMSIVAECVMDHNIERNEANANAELIASAPRLKAENEALKQDMEKMTKGIGELLDDKRELLQGLLNLTNEYHEVFKTNNNGFTFMNPVLNKAKRLLEKHLPQPKKEA